MKYRADIDGLRAIAVLLVILFHAKTGIFSGGYVGVDVFFAISGFLITSIIYQKMLAGTFTFKDFYQRRAKRILPASIFMTVVTVIMFSFMYPPDLFNIVVESAIASFLFSSNIYFWQTAGYFSPSVEFQPLLHTWSLSVEEQFYFLFPLFLLVLLKVKLQHRAILFLVFICCLLSLVLSVVFAPNSLSFIGFYVLPTRFYEMGLGSLLAILLTRSPTTFINLKYLRELGFIIILGTAYFYDKSLAFPSYYALLPVIGALLIIMDSSKSGLVYRLLCSKVFVFLGLLSYSLYLWHWPIWVALQWISESQSILITILYFVLTFVISYASYVFVEKPMRAFSFYDSKHKIRVIYISTICLFVGLFYFSFNSNKALLPLSQDIMQTYTQSLRSEPLRDECTDTKRLRGEYSICIIKQPESAKYSILLWGDSHASAMMSSLIQFSDTFHVDAINTSGCFSLLGVKRINDLDCHLHNDFVRSYLSNHTDKYDLVLNVGAWNNYIEMDLLKTDTSTSTEQMQLGINNTVEFYDAINMNYLFVSQIPKFDEPIPLAFFRFHMGLDEELPSVPRNQYKLTTDRFIDMFPNQENTISFTQLFCDELQCIGNADDILLYQDSHHISVAAAELIRPNLEQAVLGLITKSNSSNPIADTDN